MAQQIHAGQYRLELDGHQLVVRDQFGHVVETIDQVDAAASIRLPDGTTVSAADLADALADPKITEIDTAAGGDTAGATGGATGGAPDSGGLGLTAFTQGLGIGGFSAVGGLSGTTLSYGEASFTDPRNYTDGQAFYKLTSSIAVDAPTYAPIAEVVNLEANEDSNLTGAVLATDQDKDPLGFTLVEGPQHGTLQFDADGTFSYKPDPDYNGPDSFTYKANDGSHDSNVAAVNITVTPVNDAPVATDAAYKMDEDANLAGAVKATDIDGDALTYTIVDGPQHGQVQFNADGSFVYKPDADYSGADGFTYKANDGDTDSNLAKIEIEVAAVNDAPVADDGLLTIDEDASFFGAVTAGDADGDKLGYALIDGPQHGQLQLNDDGSFVYTPDTNYHGADSFTYKANDASNGLGGSDSNLAKIDITVTPVNDGPAAADGAFNTNEDQLVAGAVVASDIDGDKLGYSVVDGPQHGSLQFNADGSFVYKPDADYNGADSFTYRANDGAENSNTAKVDIKVAAINDAPVASDTAVGTKEDAPVSGQAAASDIDSSSLTYSLIDGPKHGTVVFKADGSYVYTPAADYSGADSFTFKASDGSLESNAGKIDINVAPVNDAPVAANGAVSTDEDMATSGKTAATDIDSPNLTYQVVTGPQHGSIQFNADGSFKYTPNANYNGADSFTYKANDGSLSSNVAKVDITVKPVNDAPVVTTHDATGDVHVINLDGTQKLNGSIGDYLATAGKESAAIDAKLINGVDTSTLTLSQAAEMKVNFLSEGAGYRSIVGTYTFDASGKIDPSSVKFLWLDGTAVAENTANAALVKDFLGNTQPSTVSLGQLQAGTQVGFFIVADGASNSANKTLLTNLTGVKSGSDNYASDLAAINSKLGVTIDANGNGHITVNGTALNGNTFFTHDAVLNTDANSNDMLHAISGISSKNDGKLYIGFEDLAGGGDKDYNDIIIAVDIGSYNINKLTQGVAQPTVHITDVDSTTLSGATVTTTGFHAGDHLNVPSSSLFDVTTSTSGNDTTIQVTAKSGTESIGNFESFLNGIFFSSSSTEEGSRTVHYAVTDSGGLASNIGDAHVVLTSSYDISAATLGSRTVLGTGDDTLHLNQTMSSNLDAGSGYDTARLEQTNMSFGHNEAAKLHNFEVLDATSSGKNAVTLSVDDVLTMTDTNHHLTVIGNTGDSLKLLGDGTNHWQVTHADADFTTVSFNDGTHQAVIVVSNELSLTVS